MARQEEKNEALQVKSLLDKEERVRIKIPLDPLNPQDVGVPVGINGYFLQIKRGETVEVPKTVADLLEKGKYI